MKIFDPSFKLYYLHPKFWMSWLAIILLFLFGLIPAYIRDPIARKLTYLVKYIVKKPIRIARINLKTCYPEKSPAEIEEMLHKNLESFCITSLGQGELMVRSLEHVKKRVNLTGIQYIENNIAKKRPMIFILPHVWGIDYAGIRLHLACPNMVTMIKAHRNELFNWIGNRLRGRLGGNIYLRDAGIKALIGELKQGQSFIYLPDEDLGRKRSVFAPFLGTTKATLPVVSRLAELGEADVMLMQIGYDQKSYKYNLTISPMDVSLLESKEEEANILNEYLGKAINANPEMYMWFLRILRTRPDENENIYK